MWRLHVSWGVSTPASWSVVAPLHLSTVTSFFLPNLQIHTLRLFPSNKPLQLHKQKQITFSSTNKKQRFPFFSQNRSFYYGASTLATKCSQHAFLQPRHGTTILCVRKGDEVCLAGDGQVTQGNMVVKPNAKKIRRLPQGVILGFAGATADCFTLLEKLEDKLEEHPGQLLRSCVELAKQWRTDRYLRHLEAVMIVADEHFSLELSGSGDVLESHDGILAVGSGGPYAAAAARALFDTSDLTARQICEKSMQIAASMCCHTNTSLIFETLPNAAKSKKEEIEVSGNVMTDR